MSNHMKFVFGLSTLVFLPILWHFATVFGILGEPPETRGEFFLRIGLIAAGFVIVSVITAIVMAMRDDGDGIIPDERETLIEIRAERNGGWALMVGLVVLMWFAFSPMRPMDIANAALAILAIGEAVKIVSGLIYLHGRT